MMDLIIAGIAFTICYVIGFVLVSKWKRKH